MTDDRGRRSIVTREDLGQEIIEPGVPPVADGTDLTPRDASVGWEDLALEAQSPIPESTSRRADPVVAGGFDPEAGSAFDARDYVRLPARSGPLRRLAIIGTVLIVVLLFAWRMADSWYDRQVHPAGDPGDPVSLVVEDGWTLNQIADALVENDIVTNAFIFRHWCGRNDECGEFQAGRYLLNENMDFPEAVAVLNQGPVPVEFFTVSIPEGLTIDEITSRLVAENTNFSLDEAREAINTSLIVSETQMGASERIYFQPGFRHILEGMLFPATYEVSEEDQGDEVEILQRMAEEMDRRVQALVAEVGIPPEAEELGLGPYDLVVIASLIEEEARVDIDRPKISRVIYNRLAQNIALGIDASTRYAVDKPPGEPLTESDLADPSPYNTRNPANLGLPVTPISAPGEAALRAAFAPEAGDWLYYVLTDEGGVEGAHAFADTLDEHNANVVRCQELGYC